MKVGTLALAAAILAGAAASSASALPLGASSGLKGTSEGVTLAAQKKVIVKRGGPNKVVVKRGPGPGARPHKFRYRPGTRLRRAPSHWHRYDSRPGDWSTRGCVVVGPIWWCP